MAIFLKRYMLQMTKGCDAVECDNEYCKSCPKFKFPDLELNDLFEEAKKILKDSETKLICKNLSPIQYDPQYLLQSQFPALSDFKDTSSLNQKLVIDALKDKYIYSYAFFKTPEDQKLLTENKLYFDDERLELFAQYLEKNQDFFDNLPNIVCLHINEVYKLFIQNNDSKDNTNVCIQYHMIRIIFISIYFLSLFPPNDVSPTIIKILEMIYHQPIITKMTKYLLDIFKTIPKTILRILTFIHDNITFASILNDKFSLTGVTDTEEDPDIAINPKIRNLALFVHLLRNSNPSLPTRLFVNEVFTDNFINKYDTDDLARYLQGSFSYLTIPCILTLNCKGEQLNRYFKFLHHRQLRNILFTEDPYFNIVVNRDNLINEAVQKLSRANSSDFLKMLRVKFVGEQGVDAGGVSREFFYLVCNEIFHVKYGMFRETPNGKFWFVSDEMLTSPPIYFTLMGTIIGLAIHNSTILPIRFPLLLYKKLWGAEPTLDDYEEIDPDIVHQLKNLLKMKVENPEFDFSDLEMMFYITQDVYGELKDIPLCEGGLEKKVTNENVEEYVKLYTNWLLNDSVKVAFEKFQNGFNRATILETPLQHPLHLKKIIAFDEADFLVSGEEIIHWEALKQNCQYSDGYTKNSQAVIWFWEIFDEMTADEKQQFFRFSTGSDRAPVGGLHLFKLTIQKVNDPNKLPVSHTCFNIFSLPDYTAKEEMKKKIHLSLGYAEGFGLI